MRRERARAVAGAAAPAAPAVVVCCAGVRSERISVVASISRRCVAEFFCAESLPPSGMADGAYQQRRTECGNPPTPRSDSVIRPQSHTHYHNTHIHATNANIHERNIHISRGAVHSRLCSALPLWLFLVPSLSGQPSSYLSPPRFPVPYWYLPIASSCNYYAPAVGSPCPVGAGGVVSAGWSLAVWINVRSLSLGSAHVFSALQAGYTLRLSIDASTQRLQLVDSNYAYAAPLVCSSVSKVPLYTWSLISITQWNTTADLSDSLTELYVNGAWDASCSNGTATAAGSHSMPYWDSPVNAKSNIYVGLDAIDDTAVTVADLALWGFWYEPLAAADHATLWNEPPTAIAGPQPVSIFPPIEAGTPLLGMTPRVLQLVPQTSMRGNSTFTLCLTSIPAGAGAVSPPCLSWSSGMLMLSQSMSITNPGGSNVRFTFSSTFSGVNMPTPGNNNSYWNSLFLLPPDLLFAQTVPYEQITNTTRVWHMPFGPAPATLPSNWGLYVRGSTPSTGFGFLSMYYANTWLLTDPTTLAAVGATNNAPPPMLLNSQQQGYSVSIWLNVSASPGAAWSGVGSYTPLYNGRLSWPGGPVPGQLFSLSLIQNLSIYFQAEGCAYTFPPQPLLQSFQVRGNERSTQSRKGGAEGGTLLPAMLETTHAPMHRSVLKRLLPLVDAALPFFALFACVYIFFFLPFSLFLFSVSGICLV